MATTSSSASDPLTLYDELLLEGRAPDAAAFCAAHPDHPSLAARIEALLRLRGDLSRLVGSESLCEGETPVAPEGFAISGKIGEGGMGTVFLALQHSPRRLCALKFIRHDSAEAQMRFTREADLAARLVSPGIAAVYAFGAHQGQTYLATEYVHGFSLRRLLQVADLVAPGAGVDWLVEATQRVAEGGRRGERASYPGPVSIMLDLATQVADALAHAHEHGVIHRDVKPSNIMVGLDGTAKLIDFGLAVSGDAQDGRVTNTGAFLGSYDYAAPEQLRGEVDAIGPWTDTYALGATLFEMLALRTPFESASFADRLSRAAEPPPVGPRAFNANVPPALNALVQKALDPAPERRFQDGDELAGALRSCPIGRGWLPLLPRPMIARLELNRRSTWALVLAVCAAAGFGGLYVREHDNMETMRSLHRAASRRSAQEILDWRLEARRQQFESCVPPPVVHDRRGLPLQIPVDPAHYWAAVTISHGVVTHVTPQGAYGSTSKIGGCFADLLSKLELPGVGIDEPLTLTVNFRIREPLPR